MCDCGRQSIATTGTVNHFPAGLCQFLRQGGYLRALGIVYYDHRMFQHGILANQSVRSMCPVGLAAVTKMALFTLERFVQLGAEI